MVILTQARHLHLSPPPSTAVTTILYNPTSLSLALLTSNTSSITLYPHFSPFSHPHNNNNNITTTTVISPPSTTTVNIPPPSTAATFLKINQNGLSRIIFLVSSPHLDGILLRFYMVQDSDNININISTKTQTQFGKVVKVVCNQSGLGYDERKMGVLVKASHGVSVKLAASVNVFAMYTVSDRKVRVFAVKVKEREREGEVVKLMKTGVIDCDVPVFSVSVAGGFLMLGEEGGVRVFPLRVLVKGRSEKWDKRKVGKVGLVNGVVAGSNGGAVLYAKGGRVNGGVEEKIGKHCYDNNSAKLRSMKMRQSSREGGVRFVPFKSKEIEECKSSKVSLMMSIKAISIQTLAHNKFLILDSVGELYLLSLSNHTTGSESVYEMKKLTIAMKVQNLAVLPDESTKAQTIWLSDGNYTIHAIIVSDTDSVTDETDMNDIEEKIQSPATQVIFTSEKIQEIIPLSANAILLLGQANNIFAYKIS